MDNKIEIENGNVVFNMSSADKFLSLSSKLVIPLDHIVSVSTEKASWWTNLTEFKVAGARISHVVKDGRFFSQGKLCFYVMHDPEKCITVELENETYSAIIFQVDDKEEAAKTILSSAKKARRS